MKTIRIPALFALAALAVGCGTTARPVAHGGSPATKPYAKAPARAGDSPSRPVCENAEGRRACSRSHCITIIRTGHELCGQAGRGYCLSITGTYGVGVGYYETHPSAEGRKVLAEAARARRACLRVGVDLNSSSMAPPTG